MVDLSDHSKSVQQGDIPHMCLNLIEVGDHSFTTSNRILNVLFTHLKFEPALKQIANQ